MKAVRRAFLVGMLSVCGMLFLQDVQAQETPGRDKLIAAARTIMEAARYCSFVTLDASGAPQVRTMDPFSPEQDMVVWLGTNRHSKKVVQIQHDPRVVLHYPAPSNAGYVTLHGQARIVDDPDEKAARWKPEWEPLYSSRDADYILIKVVPESLEIMDMTRGIVGDPVTWTIPVVQFSEPGGGH